MKWIIILFVLLTPIFAYSEMIEVPREELEEYLARMEADRITIEQLTISRLQLQQEMEEQKRYIQNLESQTNALSRNRVFLGGNIGYPLLNIDSMLLYLFGCNGLYILGGYNRGFNINVGYLRRL